MENKQGNVEVISKQNNAVCIDQVWYTLGPKVKMNYVKKGECEYSTEETEDDANDLVVFLRSNVSGGSQQGTIQHPAGKLEDSNTHRMSALKFAGNVYLGTGQEADAKRLTTEALEFLEKGLWITKEKVPTKPKSKAKEQYADAY